MHVTLWFLVITLSLFGNYLPVAGDLEIEVVNEKEMILKNVQFAKMELVKKGGYSVYQDKTKWGFKDVYVPGKKGDYSIKLDVTSDKISFGYMPSTGSSYTQYFKILKLSKTYPEITAIIEGDKDRKTGKYIYEDWKTMDRINKLITKIKDGKISIQRHMDSPLKGDPERVEPLANIYKGKVAKAKDDMSLPNKKPQKPQIKRSNTFTSLSQPKESNKQSAPVVKKRASLGNLFIKKKKETKGSQSASNIFQANQDLSMNLLQESDESLDISYIDLCIMSEGVIFIVMIGAMCCSLIIGGVIGFVMRGCVDREKVNEIRDQMPI